jgi:hypothetical protein
MRSKPATPENRMASFEWCLGEALQGGYPPTETGLDSDTIYALRAVADAAIAGREPPEELVMEARHAFEVELYGNPMHP